jgi:hypothetical protein
MGGLRQQRTAVETWRGEVRNRISANNMVSPELASFPLLRTATIKLVKFASSKRWSDRYEFDGMIEDRHPSEMRMPVRNGLKMKRLLDGQ